MNDANVLVSPQIRVGVSTNLSAYSSMERGRTGLA